MRNLLLLTALIASTACRYPNADDNWGLGGDDTADRGNDVDEDGFDADVDCDDNDPDVFPGAEEICNEVDDDCNDAIDDDPTDASAYYVDADGDGFGTAGVVGQACKPPAGHADEPGDCNDADEDINPDAFDIPDDTIDQDCSGTDSVACYPDQDGDGYGAVGSGPSLTAEDGSCDAEENESENNDDCLDTNANVNPGVTEVPDNGLDDDCVGGDAPPCWADVDEDTFGDVNTPITTVDCAGAGGVTNDDDCDDNATFGATIYPGAAELCDGVVNNCGNPLPANEIDNDADNKVECSITVWRGGGTVNGGDDCDDGNPAIYDNAPDLCDGFVNDCDDWDGPGDPGALPSNERDNDGDHYVDCDFSPGVTAGNWGDASANLTGDNDCDDTTVNAANIYPTASELCDGLVNNCNEWDGPSTPGALPLVEQDKDGDGYVECTVDAGGWKGTPPTGFADCQDNTSTQPLAANIFPGNTETCDGVDNNCVAGFDEDGTVALESPTGDWTDLTDLVVTLDGPNVIRSAVSLTNNGTVHFCEGTYYTTLTVSATDLTIEGVGDPASITLSGANPFTGTPTARVLTHTGNGALDLSGLTIQDGTASNGGAAHFAGSPTVAIDDVTFTDNAATGDGGAIFLTNGSLAVTGSRFWANTALDQGGAVYITTGTATFNGTTEFGEKETAAKGNIADEGGALFIANTTAPHVTVQSDFYWNEADDGAVDGYGGAILVDAGTLTLTGSEFENNFARADGGAIYVDGATLAAAGVSFFHDTAGDDGGAVAVSAGTVGFTNSDFTETGAFDQGGGLRANGGAITLSNTDFDTCDADEGGAVSISDAATLVTNSLCSFDDNTAALGGGVYFTGATWTSTGDTFDSNEATDAGGGVFIGAGTVALATTTFDSNVAGQRGGGLYIQGGGLILTTPTFSGNESDSPIDLHGGGGLYLEGAVTVTVNGGSFTGNLANFNDGGAILVDDDGTLNLNNVTLTGNEADDEGGAISVHSEGGATATVYLKDTVVHGNTADTAGGVDLEGDVLFTCEDTTASADLGGIYNNTSTNGTTPLGGGVTMIATGDRTLRSIGCQWGNGTTFADNNPADIYMDRAGGADELESISGTQLDGTHTNFQCTDNGGCASYTP